MTVAIANPLPGPVSEPVWPFDNSYARLPDRFYARLAPTPVAAPRLVKLNIALARQLGLDPEVLASPERRAQLGESIAALRHPDAARQVAERIVALLSRPR